MNTKMSISSSTQFDFSTDGEKLVGSGINNFHLFQSICGERSIKIKQTKTNLNPSCKISDSSFSVECQICYLKVQLEFIFYPVLQLAEVE